MGYKMKGPSLYKNLHVQREGYANMGDGRANSSPLQKNTGDKTKEQLIKEGFTPADADKMIKDGATTGVVENNKKKTTTNNKKKTKVSQEDFEPAYPGADYSKEEIAKMTEKEKMMKIDGYEPKKKTTKKK